MKFKTAYDEYERVPTAVGTVSRTKQSDKDACDINLIVNRYMKAGYDPDKMPVPIFGEDVQDVSDAPDYQTAMNIVAQNNSAFEQLPSSVRRKFLNSPALWMDSLIKENEARAELAVSSAVSTQTATSSPAEQQGAPAPVTAPNGAV